MTDQHDVLWPRPAERDLLAPSRTDAVGLALVFHDAVFALVLGPLPQRG